MNEDLKTCADGEVRRAPAAHGGTRRPAPAPGWPSARSAARRRPPALGPALIAAAAVAGGLLALLVSLDGLPLQDLPNHLARALVELDLVLHGGARFGEVFVFRPQLSPYLGGDVILAGLVWALGPVTGARVWVALVAASLPGALLVYLRVTRHSARSLLLAFLLSLFLTTDLFFVMGMHHYRLAVALVVLALAAWEVWLRDGPPGALLAWTALLAAGYLMHLSALVFDLAGGAAAALVGLRLRTTTRSRCLLGAVPALALVAWQAAAGRGLPGGATDWRWAGKLLRPLRVFHRYDAGVDGALLLGFGVVCVLLLARGRGARGGRRVATPAAIAGACLLTFLAMPYARGAAAGVDMRAIPLVAVFALVTALAAAEGAGGPRRAEMTLAAALAGANVVFLSLHLLPANAVMNDYRHLAARIPPTARVLPVASGPADGAVRPFHHAGALVTLESGAVTPYLFAGEITPYFRYRASQPPLDEAWYLLGRSPSPTERAAIAARFDHLLVIEPFDRARLGIATRVVDREGRASLLALEHAPPPDPGGARP